MQKCSCGRDTRILETCTPLGCNKLVVCIGCHKQINSCHCSQKWLPHISNLLSVYLACIYFIGDGTFFYYNKCLTYHKDHNPSIDYALEYMITNRTALCNYDDILVLPCIGVFPKWPFVLIGSGIMLILPSLDCFITIGTLLIGPSFIDIVAVPL